MSENISISITLPANILYKCIELTLPTIACYLNKKEKKEELSDEVEDVLTTYKSETAHPKGVIETPNLQMVNMIDDDTFDNILNSIGLNDEGKNKARKIKQDIKDGKPLDMNEVLTFTQEYKQNIANANLDLGNLVKLFTGTTASTSTAPTTSTSTTNTTPSVTPSVSTPSASTGPSTEPTAPQFDMNSILNMMGPVIANMSKGNSNNNKRRPGKRY
jgi:hypothetical protein